MINPLQLRAEVENFFNSKNILKLSFIETKIISFWTQWGTGKGVFRKMAHLKSRSSQWSLWCAILPYAPTGKHDAVCESRNFTTLKMYCGKRRLVGKFVQVSVFSQSKINSRFSKALRSIISPSERLNSFIR